MTKPVHGKGFNKIDIEKAKKIATKKRLKPGMVKGTTDGIYFTKGKTSRIEVIDWGKFGDVLDKKGLAVYECKGWMKIMKK